MWLQVEGPCCGQTALDGGDPTGSLVTSNYPIFVTAGAGLSCVDSCQSPDYVTESVPPISELGTIYVLVPSLYGDFVKVVGRFRFISFTQNYRAFITESYSAGWRDISANAATTMPRAQPAAELDRDCANYEVFRRWVSSCNAH